MRISVYAGKALPICLIALTMSFEKISIGGLGGAVSALSVTQLLILSYGLLAIVKLASREWQSNSSVIAVLVLLFGFLLFEFVSQITNDASGVFGLVRSRLVLVLLLVVAFYYFSFSQRDVKFFLLSILLGALILEISIILAAAGWVENEIGTQLDHRYFGSSLYRYRSSGLLLNYGDVSIVLSMGAVAWLELMRSRSELGVLSLFFIIVFVLLLPFAVLGAESRNAVLAVGGSVVSYLFMLFRHKLSRVSWFLALASGLGFVFGAVVLSEGLGGAVSAQLNMRGAEDPRLLQYVGAIAAYLENPVLGVGPNGFRSSYLTVEGWVDVAVHNVFLQGFVRAGFGGWLLLFSLVTLGWFLYRNATAYKGVVFLFSMYCGWIISIQFYPPLSYGSPIMWFPFSVFLASLSSKRYLLED